MRKARSLDCTVSCLKVAVTRVLLLCGVLMLAACGGGGDSDDDIPIDPTAPAIPTPEPEPEPGPGFVIGETLISPASAGTAFYQPPSTLPGSNGDVLWATEVSSATNGRIWQVLYRSSSLDGTPIAVSGWLAVPNTQRPTDGYPVVTFAHGTTGLADNCAPTRRSSPKETIALLEDFLARGFVVAATDYEGLGTPGLHQYLVGPSQTRSVLDSARAAQRFGGGSNEVILFGHSQGGHAVILTNEAASSYASELKIMGTIGSGSGVFTGSPETLDYMKSSPYKGYVVMIALAQEEAYGPADSPLSLWLTPDGIEAAQPLIKEPDGICVDQLVATYGGLSSEYLFVPNAPLPRNFSGYDRDSLPGLRTGVSPLLMIHGKYDDQLPPAVIIPWVEDTCAATDQVIALEWFETGHRVPYEDPVGAAAVVFDWIDDRFAGRTAPDDCGNVPRP
jgi:pimeloyl-ACP methyl ester carboxylesterase